MRCFELNSRHKASQIYWWQKLITPVYLLTCHFLTAKFVEKDHSNWNTACFNIVFVLNGYKDFSWAYHGNLLGCVAVICTSIHTTIIQILNNKICFKACIYETLTSCSIYRSKIDIAHAVILFLVRG